MESEGRGGGWGLPSEGEGGGAGDNPARAGCSCCFCPDAPCLGGLARLVRSLLVLHGGLGARVGWVHPVETSRLNGPMPDQDCFSHGGVRG